MKILLCILASCLLTASVISNIEDLHQLYVILIALTIPSFVGQAIKEIKLKRAAKTSER